MCGELPSRTKMRTIYLWIFALCFLKRCDGYEVTCTATAVARGVLYSVPEFKAERCWHSWTDEHHIVLATHLNQDSQLVVKQNNQTLLLKRCQRVIHYERNCISERGPLRATCHGPCVESADLIPQAYHQTSWSLMAFVIPVILVLLLVGAGVLCFVFRAHICRGGCFYSALKLPAVQNRRQSMEEGISL